MGKNKKKSKDSMIKIREKYVKLYNCSLFLLFGLTLVVIWITANPMDFPYEIRRGYLYYWEVVLFGIFGSLVLLITIFATILTLFNKHIRTETREFSREDLVINLIWSGMLSLIFLFIIVYNIAV